MAVNRDWSNLQPDALRLVLGHLHNNFFPSFQAVSGVCRSWAAAVSSIPFPDDQVLTLGFAVGQEEVDAQGR